MWEYVVERLSESGDKMVMVGKYKLGGDFFAVKREPIISDSGSRHYALSSWIFNTFLPTEPSLKNICIIDSLSGERHIIKVADIGKYKVGEEGEFVKICPIASQDKKHDSPGGVTGAFDFLE